MEQEINSENAETKSVNDVPATLSDSEEVVENTSNGVHELEVNLGNKLKEYETLIDLLKTENDKKTDFIQQLENQTTAYEKQVIYLKRDRENAVIRYATIEKGLIDAKNVKDLLEKKTKDLQKEIELLNGKIKGAAADKTRICGILDAKCHELKTCQKEIDKLKYDNSSLESKLKWQATKIKSETDGRELAEKKIEELTAEINQIKLNELNKAKEELEIERNMLAEKQLIEQKSTMILLKHDNDEKGRRIESLEKKCHQLESELNDLNSKHLSICKEHENMSQEQTNLMQQIEDSQNLIDKQTMKIAELQSNQNDLEIIRTQLSHERETCRQLKNEISLLTSQIDEQNHETSKCHLKETELLQINKELTETVVKLKNECSLNDSKTMAVTLENELIKKEKSYYENIISDLRNQIDDEIRKKNSDCQLMAKHVAEKTKMVDSLQRKIEEISGELIAQQTKNSQTVKELHREINQLKKKIDQDPSKKSPTPSTASESSIDSQSSTSNHHNEFPTFSFEPSQKSLIDRIVRLQNEIARQAEKIDFLENHQVQLVEELKKKSKLLHHYMLREQAGQLLKAKKIPDTRNMTLELSMEVNRKLQNVLEDTLLKNITLKENLDTLGLEVDQLTRKLAKK